MTISKALHKAKIHHGWLYAGTKDWASMKDRFDNQPDFRCLIVQSKKGGFGLNLQRANYLLMYESPVPVLDRVQFEARVNRQGQKLPVFIYDLVCRNTADESILAFHKHGKNLFQALVVNPDEALRGHTD
jgi:non-specific serine/threonine protein kinase